MTNSADPDQTPRSVASDLGLHFLTRLVFSKTKSTAILSDRPPFRNNPDPPLGPLPNFTKTYLYNFDPLKPHFYVVKLGCKGVYIIFLISVQKHRLWVLVRTASEYPQPIFEEKYDKYQRFLSEKFQGFFSFSFQVKFSIYLSRRVIEMTSETSQKKNKKKKTQIITHSCDKTK